MVARVVVLGGGVAGTLVANNLARRHGASVVVVDSKGRHLFQPGLLGHPLNQGAIADLERDERTLLDPAVALRVDRVQGVDPDRRRVNLEEGSLDYDWLVLATGSRVDREALPGLRSFGNNFHCTRSAEVLRGSLAAFRGGRLVIGVAGFPYKCPPSPVEFALLVEEWLRKNGRRKETEITYVYPVDGVFPNPAVSAAVRPWLEERGIRILTAFVPASVEQAVVTSADGRRAEFDLLVMVPAHKGAPFLRNSALAGPGGFVAADRHTLRVRDRVYALGDAADLPVPKSGAAAHFQSGVVVANVAAEISGRPPEASYDGHVACFLETGAGRAAVIDFDYERPPAPLKRTRRARWKKKLLSRFYFRMMARL